MENQKINFLYVLGTFPVLSETFIQREQMEVFRDKKFNVTAVAFRKGIANIPLQPELLARVSYFSPLPFKILSNNLAALFKNPVKYLRLVWMILFGEHNSAFLWQRDFVALLVG